MSTRTLLLTVWYFPIRVLRWQDAVKMIYEGTVHVVAEYDEEIRSPSTTWKAPAVVRLCRATKQHKVGVRFSRLNVYQRDDFTCQYCGRRLPWAELTYDHLVPRCRGGRTNFLNIVSACRPCNGKKGNQTCDEAGMFPLNSPAEPKSLTTPALVATERVMPLEWEPYLSPYVVR